MSGSTDALTDLLFFWLLIFKIIFQRIYWNVTLPLLSLVLQQNRQVCYSFRESLHQSGISEFSGHVWQKRHWGYYIALLHGVIYCCCHLEIWARFGPGWIDVDLRIRTPYRRCLEAHNFWVFCAYILSTIYGLNFYTLTWSCLWPIWTTSLH